MALVNAPDKATHRAGGMLDRVSVLLNRREVRRLVRDADSARDDARWSDAVSLYSAALALDGNRAGVWKQLGHALRELGDLDQAERAYERSMRLAPQNADTLLHLGHVLRLRGDRGGAVARLFAALALDPGNAAAQSELGALGVSGDHAARATSEDAGSPAMARLDALESAWRHHLPGFLNAAASVAAGARTTAALDARLTRTEELLSAIHDAVAPLGERLGSLEAAWRAQEATRPSETEALKAETAAARAAAARAEAAVAALDARADREFARQWDRLEFARRELLFELQHTMTPSPSARPEGAATRVVSAAKLDSLRAGPGGIRLNLGCGHIPLEGFLNVDRRELPGVDIVAEADELPFGAGEVHEIASAHLLEHFPQEAVRRRLLPYWRRLLVPGGRLTATVPDGDEMLAAIARGDYAFEDFREVLFGGQDYRDDFHYNLFTPASLTALVEEAGFERVSIPTRARRNGKCFEFTLCAVRP